MKLKTILYVRVWMRLFVILTRTDPHLITRYLNARSDVRNICIGKLPSLSFFSSFFFFSHSFSSSGNIYEENTVPRKPPRPLQTPLPLEERKKLHPSSLHNGKTWCVQLRSDVNGK